ncbi:hypothetical protein LY56_02787 [Roseinatronobacter thiooxidans]|uniref:Autotransporter domain-containing protein n=2 Tax=Roseinatronobacter thiooxidans TaxID=121821 RepID=A0A2W7PT81_9RHOB|nr:hypothetical protein LY56_02787 [Roseinatronobacter thiooxidans]
MVLVNKMALPGKVARMRSRKGMLLSSVFLGIGAGSIGAVAFANDAAIGGVDCPACVLAGGQISVAGGFLEVDINVDTASIGSSGAPAFGVGVYAYSTEDITVTATQDITTTDRTMWLDSNSITPGQGDITVTSSGALTSTLSHGVEILHPLAELVLDGQSTGTIDGYLSGVSILGWPGAAGTLEIRDFASIIGGTTSIYVDNSFGADVSIQGVGQVGASSSLFDGIFINAPSGNINIGGQSALGSVQGGDDGLELYTSGAGTITVNAGDVTGVDWGIYAIGTEGNAEITVTGAVEGTNFVGIETRTTTGDITLNAGDVTGGTWGIYTLSTDGDANITTTGAVEGKGAVGIETRTTTGDITLNAGDVTGGTWGIYTLSTDGDANITTTGAVEGKGAVGIETHTTTGDITLNAGDVTGGTWGIYTRSTDGDTAITVTGDVAGGTAMAIDTITTTGNVTIGGSGTATATGGDLGIWAGTIAGGSVTVQDFDTVTSVDTAIYTYSAGGDITITGVGTGGGITSSALDGIYASTQSGNGNVVITGNGPITAAGDGIVAYSFGGGTMAIGVDADISAVEFGIYSRSVNGDLTLGVAEGVTVSATGITGIDATASGAGTTTIDVAADAVVEGGAFGLVTGTRATVSNAGTIRTIGDTGAATDAGTGIGLWSWTGTTEVNNSGDMLGQIHSDGGGVTFNNMADGSWYVGTGLHEFYAANDAVNNTGTMFIRNGVTNFDGLERFVTSGGGHIDMTYGTAATDTLQVLNFGTQAGALLSFDFDAKADNNAGLGHDNSDDGFGTADTIWVTGTAAPEAGTLVAVNHLDGDPTGLVGSVALVYTGVNLDAPNPRDRIVSSDLYDFATPQSFTTTAFYLVDDGDGGLYYQWAPNITTATMGGYGGGDMSDGATTASNIASAGAAFAGLGGLGGTGGGATGAIADSAMASVRGTDKACENGQASRFWTHADGSSTSGRGFKGNSYGITFGYEHDLGAATGQTCGQFVGGIFAGVGRSNLSWASGTSKSANVTTGAYLRYAAPTGLYATGVAAVTRAKADLTNAVFSSTGSQKSLGYAGIASIGYVMPVSAAGHIDWRASLSHGIVDGKPFTDSVGIEVDDTKSRMTTAGLNVAYWHQIDETTRGFVSAGVNRTQAKRETTAFGVKVDGTSKATIGTLSAGLSSKVSDRSSLDVVIHGAFSDRATSIGGSIGYKLAF